MLKDDEFSLIDLQFCVYFDYCESACMLILFVVGEQVISCELNVFDFNKNTLKYEKKQC